MSTQLQSSCRGQRSELAGGQDLELSMSSVTLRLMPKAHIHVNAEYRWRCILIQTLKFPSMLKTLSHIHGALSLISMLEHATGRGIKGSRR